MNALMHREDRNGITILLQASLYVAITDTHIQTIAKLTVQLVEN